MFITFSFFFNSTHGKINSRLYQSRNIQSRTNLYFCGCNLGIISISVKFTALLHFMVNRFVRRIITKAIQRIFTSMESAVTGICCLLFVLLALFVLKSTASHVLVEPFVTLNYFFHFSLPPLSNSHHHFCGT